MTGRLRRRTRSPASRQSASRIGFAHLGLGQGLDHAQHFFPARDDVLALLCGVRGWYTSSKAVDHWSRTNEQEHRTNLEQLLECGGVLQRSARVEPRQTDVELGEELALQVLLAVPDEAVHDQLGADVDDRALGDVVVCLSAAAADLTTHTTR